MPNCFVSKAFLLPCWRQGRAWEVAVAWGEPGRLWPWMKGKYLDAEQHTSEVCIHNGRGLCLLSSPAFKAWCWPRPQASALSLQPLQGCLAAKLASSASLTAAWKSEQLMIMVAFWPEAWWSLYNSVFLSQGCCAEAMVPTHSPRFESSL